MFLAWGLADQSKNYIDMIRYFGDNVGERIRNTITEKHLGGNYIFFNYSFFFIK